MVGETGELGHELTVLGPPGFDAPFTRERVGIDAFDLGPFAVGTGLGPLLSHRRCRLPEVRTR